jgi:hypothetical protein
MASPRPKSAPRPAWRWLPTPRLMVMLLPSAALYIAVIDTPVLEGKRLAALPAFCAPLLFALAFWLMWECSRAITPIWLLVSRSQLPHWMTARPLRALIIIPWALFGLLVLATNVQVTFQSKPYYNGSLAYLHSGADAILHRHNPYSSSDLLWDASLRWPDLLATPLLRGRYQGKARQYPTPQALQALMQQEARDPRQRHGEFDPATAHNYPAAAYWMVLPVVWSGGVSIQWVNLAAIVAMALLVVLRAPPRARLMLGIIVLCQTIVYYTSFDALCLVFVLAAWHAMSRPRLSAGLLGWACAIKQLAWFFVPFYLIEVARRKDWRTAAEQGCWVLGWFLLPNLPFILVNPGAWFASQFVPMRDLLFPGGIGIIAPAIAGLWPLWLSPVYGALEGIAWVGLIVWQARRQAVTADGLLLALIPLVFAWRSFGTYVALAPLLALWLIAGDMHNASPVSRSRRLTQELDLHQIKRTAATATAGE